MEREREGRERERERGTSRARYAAIHTPRGFGKATKWGFRKAIATATESRGSPIHIYLTHPLHKFTHNRTHVDFTMLLRVRAYMSGKFSSLSDIGYTDTYFVHFFFILFVSCFLLRILVIFVVFSLKPSLKVKSFFSNISQ